MLALVLGGGCGGGGRALSGDRDPGDDRAAYLAVVADPGVHARCDEIRAPALRAECVAMAAHSLAAEGALGEAQALCAAVPAGAWRDECPFLACEGAALTGRDAIQCCAAAGGFRRQCLGHAMGRDGMAAFEAHPRGAESAGLEAVVAVIARYQGPEAGRRTAEQIVRAALLQRAPEGPLDAAVCGDVDEAICATVYEEMLRQATRATVGAPEVGLRAACGRTVSVERVAALGLPTWTPAVDGAAARAWARVCRR